MNTPKVSKEHVVMCSDLSKAVRSNMEEPIIELVTKYQSRLHALLDITTEELIVEFSGSTLVHLMFQRDYCRAYELLVSMLDCSNYCNMLHRQNNANMYPIDFSTSSHEILKFSLYGSWYVVKRVHLDMHMDKILNSQIAEEIHKDYGRRLVPLMLRLVCLFGSYQLVNQCFWLHFYVNSQDTDNPYESLINDSYDLNTLAQIGGNDLTKLSMNLSCICRANQVIPNLMASITMNKVTNIQQGINRFMSNMNTPIYDQTGARALALAKACLALKMTNQFTQDIEKTVSMYVVTMKFDKLVYVHSLIKSIVKLDPSLCTRVSLYLYLRLLHHCDSNTLTEELCDPLYELFAGKSADYDREHWINNLLNSTFSRVQSIRGVPLLQVWIDRFPNLNIMNAKPYMLATVKYMVGSLQLAKMEKKLEGPGETNNFIKELFETYMSFKTYVRNQGTPQVNVSVDMCATLLKVSLDEWMSNINLRLDVENSVCGIMVHCAQKDHPLIKCVDALNLVRDLQRPQVMYRLGGVYFLNSFVTNYMNELKNDGFQLVRLCSIFDNLIFCRPTDSCLSVHELLCRSTLAEYYISNLTMRGKNFAQCYSVMVWVLLELALDMVSTCRDKHVIWFLVEHLQYTLQGFYRSNILGCIFVNILTGVMQKRAPRFRLVVDSRTDQHQNIVSMTPPNMELEWMPQAMQSPMSPETEDSFFIPYSVEDPSMDFSKPTTLQPDNNLSKCPEDCFRTNDVLLVDSSWLDVPDLSIFTIQLTMVRELIVNMHREIIEAIRNGGAVDPKRNHHSHLADLQKAMISLTQHQRIEMLKGLTMKCLHARILLLPLEQFTGA